MKCLRATLLCLIIAVNLREGTSSKHDISAYLKEIGQYKAFGSVNFITPLKGLTVPECFIRENKILNHKEIQVLITSLSGHMPTVHNVSSLEGDDENFRIITLAKTPARYEKFSYSCLPIPSDFDRLHHKEHKMIYGLEKEYDHGEMYSPVKFLSSSDNYMEFLAHSIISHKGNWLGGGIFINDKVIAICYHQEYFRVGDDDGYKVSCRSIYTIFKQQFFHYLPNVVQERLLPMWYPEKLEGHQKCTIT